MTFRISTLIYSSLTLTLSHSITMSTEGKVRYHMTTNEYRGADDRLSLVKPQSLGKLVSSSDLGVNMTRTEINN